MEKSTHFPLAGKQIYSIVMGVTPTQLIIPLPSLPTLSISRWFSPVLWPMLSQVLKEHSPGASDQYLLCEASHLCPGLLPSSRGPSGILWTRWRPWCRSARKKVQSDDSGRYYCCRPGYLAKHLFPPLHHLMVSTRCEEHLTVIPSVEDNKVRFRHIECLAQDLKGI